jgi:two-component system, NtrC family, sensor histidine kinase HydH
MGAMANRLRLRVQDILLAILFGALIYLAHDAWERAFILSLAVLQLMEGRMDWLNSGRGRATSVILQFVICYLLIGYTGGVTTAYYLVLLFPVVSTATYLGLAITTLSFFVAIGAYVSFLLYGHWQLDTEDIHLLLIRCILPAIIAVLVNSLGESTRTESARYKRAAEQLAVANQNLVKAETAVRRSERLAALGQLSAGLAHELRNPLSSIKGSAELLARSAARDNPMANELAQIIIEEAERTNSLVTRFLDFARPLEPRRQTVDVTRIIDRAARRAGVPIIRNYSPDVPPLKIDPELMEQVFLNLLTNASQASSPGAPITAAIRADDGLADISIVDRGCGIAPEKIDSIFNPFVTTKQNGVGLGLAIVAKIVDGHGGRMAVESALGKGSAFHVLLPIQT